MVSPQRFDSFSKTSRISYSPGILRQMLTVKTSSNGNLDIYNDEINLGFWSDSDLQRTVLYFGANSFTLGHYKSKPYLDLHISGGWLRVDLKFGSP